ncbi:MAG: GNAT family N-acetyltransferase [Treponema sp.]|nr:GNAT family N-acetyltransferase [Treponema sp.]
MQEFNNFIFKKAELSDLNAILPIIEDSKAYLRQNGVDQWQDGFPNPTTLSDDISTKHSFVIFSKGNTKTPARFLVLSLEPEEPYHHPIEGELKLEGPYTTIHRTAVSKENRGNGISKAMFAFSEDFALSNGCKVLRVDTHKDNKIMQHILTREGFNYCCLVQLPPQDNIRMRRLVFEKSI